MVTRGTQVISSMIGAIFITLFIQVSALATSTTEETKGHKSEAENELLLLDQLDPQSDLDDRLVILPEIKREGERFFLSSFKLPDKITFAGLSVPLDNWQVRERIEYEFYQFLEDQGESIILAKRTGRCFPPAERQLADAGLPDDLKYMLLVESKCISAAYSKAKASGPWQFIPSTGRRYRLKSDAVRDERRNLEMSTEAAVKYLKYLKQYQNNDWFLAMASYNAGEERIRKLLKAQKIDDYWKMHGPRETMRYVPRIIAAKEIYSQPEKYLGLTKKDLYMPLETETITVNVKESQRALTSIAEEFGTYLLELKMLNPEFKKDMLPRGNYQIRVPRQTCPSRCFKQEKTP
ncbi:MAG: lytic transglycosylase domain-containing protein [Nitrospira sp.]|nr:lytic transglycosylase domain-containing protein [Nitrospira sp.]MDH4244670.1 lytic transglycosylase domain-containing protein [Nitrospira sp.]MDH4357204.1 lytic transglycosylase domain-containing protein [Nitrospira sp.]MDH5319556.1 lytic transglycosylase domain-containing protein [Nitrospira sp.]